MTKENIWIPKTCYSGRQCLSCPSCRQSIRCVFIFYFLLNVNKNARFLMLDKMNLTILISKIIKIIDIEMYRLFFLRYDKFLMSHTHCSSLRFFEIFSDPGQKDVHTHTLSCLHTWIYWVTQSCTVHTHTFCRRHLTFYYLFHSSPLSSTNMCV